MRRALGLTGVPTGRAAQPQLEQPRPPSPGRPPVQTSTGRPRHRFVPDGAVPVTVINRHRGGDADAPTPGHGAIGAALQDERAARERAERSLQEALATIRDLQTKLGHAELACRETSGTAEAARAAADALRAEYQERELRWHEGLGAERAARLLAEATLAEATRAREPAQRTRVSALAAQPAPDLQDASPAPVAKVPGKPAAKRTPKSAAEPRQREPQPVKWWLRSARKRWP